jgi:hypothetical protein
MNTTHVFCAQLEVHACRAELQLNGFPLDRLGPDAPLANTIPAQQYLVPGTNELEVLVEPGARPSRARTETRTLARPGAYAKVRLVRFPDGASPEPENGEILLELAWRDETGKPALFPQSRAGTVEMGAAAGRWAWQDAPELVLDEALADEAHAVLEAIADCFRTGSAEAYEELRAQQSADAVRAYPALLGRPNPLAAHLAYYRRSPRPVAPLVRARHDFRLVAKGRVVECVDEDGRPSLRLRDPVHDMEVACRIFMARIGGRLRIVR